MDFERFTNKAKECVAQSQQILRRYKHNQIDVEHVLLSLLEQEGGVVPRVLEKMGVDAEALSASVERELGKQPQVEVSGTDTGQIFITPQAGQLRGLRASLAGDAGRAEHRSGADPGRGRHHRGGRAGRAPGDPRQSHRQRRER